MAEGVAVQDYRQLFIDKGTVIHATRNYQTFNFEDILKKNVISNRYLVANPDVGGWAKFAKTYLTNVPVKTAPSAPARKKAKQQQKKNGRGWLHT